MHKNKLLSVVGATALVAVLSSNVYASGFQSFETDASGLGNAYAGGAAIANDATTEFDNPAGIVRLQHPELDASTVAVMAHGNFTENTSVAGGVLPVQLPGTKSVNPLDTNYLPAIHFATPLYDGLFFGFGMTVPFGYDTNYGNSSMASNFATKSQIETINLNPSLAYAFNNQLSIGAGFDAQYLKAELNRNLIDLEQTNMSYAFNSTADDWAYGWNAGLMYQFTDATRAGFAYRSKINHSPSGKMAVIVDDMLPEMLNVNTNISMPDSYTLSAYHDFNQNFAVMASLAYIRWSCFNSLTMSYAYNLVQPTPVTITENFRNTYRGALGANYRFNQNWMIKFGAAYDQSPVTDSNRTIQLPDGDRVWLSTGLEYDFAKYVTLNAGYSHIFIKNGSLNYYDSTSQINITGNYDHTYANLIGAQIGFKFE